MAFKPNYNVAPTHNVAVVTNEGERQIEFQRWGLIPFWAKDMKTGFKMINARSETLLSNGAFKHAFKRRRCLILADSFYEWKKKDGIKIPMRIGLKNWEPFAFAGLWESWRTKRPTKRCVPARLLPVTRTTLWRRFITGCPLYCPKTLKRHGLAVGRILRVCNPCLCHFLPTSWTPTESDQWSTALRTTNQTASWLPSSQA